MDKQLFFTVFGIGMMLIIWQGVCSYEDGYLTHAQLRRRGIDGYSFFVCGAVYANVGLSVLLAYILTKYRFHALSLSGIGILVIALAATIGYLIQYKANSVTFLEAHAHNGKITFAGWINAAYMLAAIWVLLMFYWSVPSTVTELAVFLVVLFAYYVVSLMKFDFTKWGWDDTSRSLLLWQIVATVIVTAIKMIKIS